MSDDQSPNGAILQQQITPEKDPNSSIMNKVKSRVSSIFPNKLTKWFSPTTTNNENKNNGTLRRRRDSSDDEENQNDNNREVTEEVQSHMNENIVSNKVTNIRRVSGVLPPPNKRQKSDLNEENSPGAMKQNNRLLLNTAKYNNYQSSTPALMPYRRNFVRNINKNSTPYAFTKENMQFNNNLNEINKVVNDENNEEIGETVKLDDTDDDNDCIEIPEMPKIKKITSRKSIRDNELDNSLSERRTLNINNNYDRNLPSTSRTTVKNNIDSNDNLIKANDTSSININHNNENNDEDDDVDNEINAVVNNEVVLNNDTGSESSESTSGCSSMQAPTNSQVNHQNKSYLRPQSSAGRINSNVDLLKNDSQINEDNRRVSGLFGNKKRSRAYGPGILNTTSGQITPTGSGLSNIGINFSTHLQTDKSLFSNKNLVKNSLNNSTTSLNSLVNRRQSFNASLYGSTSALSDGKLFSTSSPFYSGKTMYGGSSAYPSNKRLNIQPTQQQNTLRIPIQIRPSSSLSTLSSNTSLGTNNINNSNNNDTTTSLSNTAKRILELMNQFTTPLQEAKKMASTNNIRFQSKDRSQNKINRITSPRLTPYNRPNNNSNMKTNCPNINELEVPTMSQLLQMKKLLNTEKVRKLADNSNSILNKKEEYKLPENNDAVISIGSNNTNTNSNGGKHVNKIKNKLNSSRASSKDIINEELLPIVTLPNISLPIMKSVPKFDIAITQANSTPALIPTKTLATTFKINKEDNSFNNNTFKFSSPLCVNGKIENQAIIPTNHFKFSKPLDILNTINSVVTSAVPNSPPILKTGSCLDILKGNILSSDNSAAKATSTNLGFGTQFKLSSDKWECDVCMIRNCSTVDKCVACETPKPGSANNKTQATLSAPKQNEPLLGSIKNSFGDKFKTNSTATWECDTCMIVNKNEDTKCIACETPKPGSKVTATSTNSLVGGIILPTTTFKFGFQPTSTPSDSAASKPVTSIPNFGIQQNSKWECTACSAKIDSNRNKCTCCDQAKPGSKTENIPQFSFGNSANKISFGFPSGSENKKEELPTVLPTTGSLDATPKFSFGLPTTTAKTTLSDIKFGAVSETKTEANNSETKKEPTGFLFGTKPSEPLASPAKSSVLPSGGFVFSGNNTLSKSETSTDSPVKFGVTSSNTTSIISSPVALPPKNKELTTSLFGSATSSAISNSIASAFKDSSSNTTPVFGTANFGGVKSMPSFLFGTPEAKPKEETELKKEANTTNTNQPPSNEFVFKSPSNVTKDASLLTNTTIVPSIKSNETVQRIGGFENQTIVSTNKTEDFKNPITTDAAAIPKPSIGGYVFSSSPNSTSLVAGGTGMQNKATEVNAEKPKTNLFTFGSSISNNNNNNTLIASKPPSAISSSLFGNFGSPTTPATTTQSQMENNQTLPQSTINSSGTQATINSTSFTFGSNTKSNTAPPPPYEVIGFGQSGTGSSLPAFGSFSANNNIFGSLASSPGFGQQPPPQPQPQSQKRNIHTLFGSSYENTPVGGAPKQPTGTQFGVFGSGAMGGATSEQATADFGVKRSAPFEFNNYTPRPFAFGASNANTTTNNNNNNNQQTNDTANKPAFSFNATAAPSFNFSTAPQVQQQTQQPFTFRAQPSATTAAPQQQQPLFNFTSTTNTANETAQNATYQFDSINNPFAATSGGVNANQQQGLNRRKIRGVRRVTPR